MGRLLALIAALLMGGLIAWRVQTPPEPEPADAPAQVFSAARAFADVAAIARTPHPTGSAASLQVRDHLRARMAALGLSPRLQDATGVRVAEGPRTIVRGAEVQNLIGVLPGRDRDRPAVALLAHYDSAPGSPGAADDAAGVSVTLEVVRALKARGVPERDVVVLFTDAEEVGLLGAEAFFSQDPLARRIGFVLNMEARGGGGRALMFETGRDAGADIDLFARAAREPQALSLTSYLYARMPNDTDFTLAREASIPGFNYAWLGRAFDYHSPTSTPARLDRHALQDMGGQVLAATSAVAFQPDLPNRAPDKVYGQLFRNLMIVYPPAAGWLVIGLAAGLLAVAYLRGRRLAPIAGLEIARGAGALLFAATGAAAVLHFARRASGVGFGWLEQRALLAQPVRWEACLTLLGIGFLILAAAELARGRRAAVAVPLLAGLASCLFGEMDRLGLALGLAAGVIGLIAYGRPVSRPAGWAGVLAASLLVAAIVQGAAPAVAPVLAWPLLLACAAAAATALSARERRPYLLVLGLAAGLGLGWIAGTAHLIHLALDAPELLAMSVWMSAALIWPLAQPVEGAPPARLVGPLLLAAGLAVLFAVRFDPPWSTRHPQAVEVGYRIDQDRGADWWTADVRTPWTDAVMGADGGAIAPEDHWSAGSPGFAAPASRRETQTVALLQEAGALSIMAPARTFRVDVKPSRPARLVGASGRALNVSLRPGAWTSVIWTAPPAGGLTLRFRGEGGRAAGPMEVRFAARFDGMPDAARPPMPGRLMAFHESGTTEVVGTYRAAW
ncbi:M20/M25/M40 family metallo-hydrolase [Phenylobacterium immobile]|uniref:M20/M25/M40 family metallo-hydrolase n=1 Tax=Phenylobacterium immobile TaxID=21 RepID=UPI000B0A06B5|nr:M20/M25/M40 family metallo-hydrolase [Phenylobacterium immobile]